MSTTQRISHPLSSHLGTFRSGVCLIVILIAATAAAGQAPTPTPINKSDPPTVQTPSTTGRITKWTGVSKSGIGIIGDSVITESGGNIGIDSSNPLDKLSVGGNMSAAGSVNATTQYNLGGSKVLSGALTKLNLFVGFASGNSNGTGDRNAFFGANSGVMNTAGSANSFFGVSAGYANTTGGANAFFGLQAGFSTTSGNSNSFFGAVAGNLNTTGSQNAFFGNASGYRTNSGNNNSFFGTNAGFNNTAGVSNAFFGFNSGQSNTIESNNTFIGANANGVANINNATALGANAVVTQSNSIVLGSNANVGIGISAPQAKLHVVGSSAGQFDGNVAIGGNLSVTGTANLTATNAIHANSADTSAAVSGPVNGSQINGALVNATMSGNAITGNIAASQVSGNLGNATINGSQVVGTVTNANEATTAKSLSGEINQSQVTNLVSDLAAKATDSAVVHRAGDETITGTKTFGGTQLFNSVNAAQLILPTGTINSLNGSLRLQGTITQQGTTGGFLDLGPGNFYYPGGTVTLGAGTNSPQYGSGQGSYIKLFGNDYHYGGDILIASGHSYGSIDGQGTGGTITLATSTAYGGNHPPPGPIVFKIGPNERFRVNGDGNVGIGTVTPGAPLEVRGRGTGPIFKVVNDDSNVAGQFDGNVTINGNLVVTGATNISTNLVHDSSLSGTGTAASPLSVLNVPNGVVTTGSYANPSWITSLDGSKLTAGSAVKSVNNVTDNVTLAAGSNVTITQTGNTLTIAASTQPLYNPKQIALLRWYEANTTNNSFAVGNKPVGLAFDGSSMWVANLQSDNVMKLRASDGAVLGTFAVGTNPAGIAFDGANIWVNNYGSANVSKLQASDGTLLGTYAVGINPFGVAFDGANIWVANSGNGTLTRLAADTGAPLSSHTLDGNPLLIASDGKNIWVTNHGGSNVWKLRGSDGAVVGNYAVGSNPYGIAFDGANMWVANEGSNNVMKLRLSDGAVLGTYAVGDVPRSVTFDGQNIWVSNAYSGDLTKLRASDGALLGRYAVGSFPEYLAFDGANIWVANGGSNNVMKR